MLRSCAVWRGSAGMLCGAGTRCDLCVLQIGRTERQATSVVHSLRYLPGKDALKLRAEVRVATAAWLLPPGDVSQPQLRVQVAMQLAAAQRQRARLDKQLWNLTKQGV